MHLILYDTLSVVKQSYFLEFVITLFLVCVFMSFSVLCVLQLEMILPERAYAFFSHTHKAQEENMPLLDKVRTVFFFVGKSKNSFHSSFHLFSPLLIASLRMFRDRIADIV